MQYHTPVMVKECLEMLNINPDGVYVDLTFGGGGHAESILKVLNKGRLIAFDQDEDVTPKAKEMETRHGEKMNFIQTNFKHFAQYLKMLKIKSVDGILLDLGVSSHQFDSTQRGFSFRYDSNLDMRMNQHNEKSAFNIINAYSKKALKTILENYGEIRNAKTLSERIVNKRYDGPIKTTFELKEIAEGLAPRPKVNQYLAQVFQAIRIEVNDEINTLVSTLHDCSSFLGKQGRMVVLSYHSLEDRVVKNYILKGKAHGDYNKDFYGNIIRPLDPVIRKPLMATTDEISINSRARSAKLRVATKRDMQIKNVVQ